MSQAGLINSKGGGGGSNVQTLTGNTGGAVGPTSNNINVVGATLYTVAGSPGTSTLTVEPLPNAYPITPYVVGPVGAAGYQTIQSALNAVSTLFGPVTIEIQPGAYVENLNFTGFTFPINVHLRSTTIWGTSSIDSVTIEGIFTVPTSGLIHFEGITFLTNGAGDLIANSSVGTTVFYFRNINYEIGDGNYLLNLPNWTGKIILDNVTSDNPLFPDGAITNSGGSPVTLFNCLNLGVAGGATMTLSGATTIQNCTINCPVQFVTGTNVNASFSNFNNTLLISNNSTGSFNECNFNSGSSAAITMSSNAAIEIADSFIASSNSPAIAGSGTGLLTLKALSFSSNDQIANTLTVDSTGGYYPSNYTNNGFLLGQGPQCIKATAAPTNGQLPIGSTGNSPVINTLTAGSNITITNAPGSITISATGSSAAPNYVSVNHAASPYTVLASNYYISCDPSGGTISVLLPNSPTLYEFYIIKDRTGSASTNNISITTVGGSINIDGVTTYKLTANYESVQLIWNGTSYEIF